MRYDKKEFDKAVNYYKEKIDGKKNLFVFGKYNKRGFFSLAPLSRAAAELNIDMYVSLNSNIDEILEDVWKAYENNNSVLIGFIKKTSRKIESFEGLFEKPDLILELKKSKFEGNINLDYKGDWFVPFMEQKLRKTTNRIVKEVFALKNNELFSVGFALIPNKKLLQDPLQDYLDSYAICDSMYFSSKDKCKKVTIKAGTLREGQRDEPEKISELITTLLGLELEKEISKQPFIDFKKVSKELYLNRLKLAEATFFISSKGYHGKHLFGEKIGYPTKNMKSTWNSPAQMIYKFHWYPQSWEEERPPKSRVSFTSTVPIDKLIESTLINYEEMRKRNKQIGDILEGCEKVVVKSNIKDGCDFEVGLIKNGKRRLILYSDSDTRFLINPRIKKETGKDMGMMANIPGGEAFTTPAHVKGKIVGDVVINIDKSYRLNENNPFIATVDKEGYKLFSGPKKVVEAFNKRKKEAWENIREQEKNKSLPKKIIELKKNNFDQIGEFAINTNPNASLCDYLIINEKIANMIHIAFGAGFEPDTATEYHMDVVIDSPRQKLDIYGIGNENKKKWIIKNGSFVI